MMPILLIATALTFAQARARADAESPDLRALRFGEPQAQAAVETAKQLPNPSIAATFGGQDPQESVTLDQRLPFLGQRQRAVAAAEREIPVAQAQIAAGAVHLAASIRRAYFGLAAAQAGLQLATEMAALAGQIEGATRGRVDNGSASQLELLQASVARGRAQQATLERMSALARAQEELGALLGIGQEAQAALEASDPLDGEADAPALDALFSRQEDHPEVAAKRFESQASEARASAERAQVIPVPDVSIGVERGQQAPTTALRVGLSFELPLLSWNGGKVHEAELAGQRAAAEGVAAQRKLAGELRAARARWEQARARAKLATGELVPAANQLLSLARTAYELGRAPLLAVISAQSDLLASRSSALDALLDVQRALADIEEAIGARL